MTKKLARSISVYFLFFLTDPSASSGETKKSRKKECFPKQVRDWLAFFPGQRTGNTERSKFVYWFEEVMEDSDSCYAEQREALLFR